MHTAKLKQLLDDVRKFKLDRLTVADMLTIQTIHSYLYGDVWEAESERYVEALECIIETSSHE